MKEQTIIDQTAHPVTVARIAHDLRQLGIRPGDTVLVHSSLSSLGWVCGGAQAAIQGLMQAVGVGAHTGEHTEGTLVMPAQSGDWSDPAKWENPPIPGKWIDIIYKEMPAYEPALTPTRGMGRIAEMFRTWPGTRRSGHPQVSFCANGKHAERIVADHPLTPQFGMASPLGKLYHERAKVLLMGARFDTCTSLHLAEALVPNMPVMKMGTAMLENGQRVWKWFTDFAYDSEDFANIGAAFEREGTVICGKVGNADCKLFDIAAAVDFAVKWLGEHRLKQENGAWA
ncbi:aminoglycoside N(3)-acetyltransferase [Gorillibacterium massiliense]|uniref:aminoglycoside N(3)-acetyltransferase n=1 Tax=Gorillibacterium massiliense TaxID=1280390 RepID=UPI0004B635E8|nr:AAC(3) family N-acetyltransferase [Gorillibacterium massiliense]